MRGFQISEFQNRLKRAQLLMADKKLDALFFNIRNRCQIFYWLSDTVLGKPNPSLVSAGATNWEARCGYPFNRSSVDVKDMD